VTAVLCDRDGVAPSDKKIAEPQIMVAAKTADFLLVMRTTENPLF
jgi:hypothetical protein